MTSTPSKVFPAMLDTSSKRLLQWTPIPNMSRLRRKFQSRIGAHQAPGSSLATMQTSFDPRDSIRDLRAHRWGVYDAQYLLLIILGIFCLSVIEEPGPFFKTFVATLLMGGLLMPITRQFLLPFLPIAAWLVLFFACRFIPSEWRPHIWVRVLPALENILYGANLSNILSRHQYAVFDVLAWLPYGIIHFGAPFVVSGLLFIFGAPGTVPVWARAFGYMNIIGVTIQLCFPCSPPWYENIYGLAPANYSIPGSPAGLARVDQLFGWNLYTSTFTASPQVFGAFPSLHSGSATIEALFLGHVFPRLRPLFFLYTMWIWWATLYLQHHYAVDLIAGSLLSGAIYYICRVKFLPKLQESNFLRWDYDYLEIGTSTSTNSFGLTDFDDYHSEDDEWTVGSSSSIASGCRSPVSPIDDMHSVWESSSETLGGLSDREEIDIDRDARP